MLYTPPVFSDHIGVTLLLQPFSLAKPPAGWGGKESDRQTRETQPHKKQVICGGRYMEGRGRRREAGEGERGVRGTRCSWWGLSGLVRGERGERGGGRGDDSPQVREEEEESGVEQKDGNRVIYAGK